LIGVVLISGCSLRSKPAPGEIGLKKNIIGTKLHGVRTDAGVLVEKLKSAGINTVFAGRGCFDKKQQFIGQCHKHGIKIFAIFGVFVDSSAIKKDPSLATINAMGKPTHAERKWYRLVCPNRLDYRKKKKAQIVAFLAKHPVDGLSLDFIRYGVEWEMIKPEVSPGLNQEYCFCAICLKKFGERYTLPGNMDTPELARYILKNYSNEWTMFKCESITSMVKEIRESAEEARPGIKIAIHALPWTEKDYNDGARRLGGQDFKALSQYADILSPMCYHYMLYRKDSSIHDVAAYMAKQDCCVVPCVQAAIIFRKDDIFLPQQFGKAIDQALLPPSSGINLYTWGILEKMPESKKVWIEKLGRDAH